MNTELSQRLALALETKGVSQAELARRMEVNPSTASHWITGRRIPDIATVDGIADKLGVNRAWLAFGDGPMADGAPDSDEHAAAPSSATATQLDGTPCTEAA